MKKIIILGIAGIIITYSFLDAAYSYDQKTTLNKESSRYERTSRFIKTFDRYQEACLNHNRNEIEQLVREALLYFYENTLEVIDNEKSCRIRFYKNLAASSVNNPLKLIKLHIFALDFAAMNLPLTDHQVVAAISCYFFINMKGNLHNILFCYDQKLMPTMKCLEQIDLEEQVDIYDSENPRLLHTTNTCLRKSLDDNAASTQS